MGFHDVQWIKSTYSFTKFPSWPRVNPLNKPLPPKTLLPIVKLIWQLVISQIWLLYLKGSNPWKIWRFACLKVMVILMQDLQDLLKSWRNILLWNQSTLYCKGIEVSSSFHSDENSPHITGAGVSSLNEALKELVNLKSIHLDFSE